MMDKVDADLMFFGPRRANVWPITAEEATRQFPEAMVMFDWQCSHLAERGDVILTTNKKGRLGAEHSRRPSNEPRIFWRAEVGLWIRYSVFVRPLTAGFTRTCDVCRWEFSLYAFPKLKFHVPETPNWCKDRIDTCGACVRKLRKQAHTWRPMSENWGSATNSTGEERMESWLDRGGY